MNASKSKADLIFLYGMVASMFCWGLSWTSGKILTNYGSPFQISFLRFFVTFFSLLFILFFTKDKLTISRKGIPDLLAAAVMIALYTYLFFQGLIHGKAGAGGVLVTILNPIISYVLMLFLNKRYPNQRETIGLLFGVLAGSILLKLWESPGHIFDQRNSYFLLASLSWAVLSVFTSKSSRYGSPVVFSLWMYGICFLMLFFLVGNVSTIHILQGADLSFWGNLFFSATITTALATTFYFVATARLGAGKASSFIFMVPLSAALGSFIFLGEIPQFHTLIGGFLGIIAVYIINSKKQ